MFSASTQSYITPHSSYWWQWAKDGWALELRDESTIALWMEIYPLLRSFARQGLPPLGSILLVLLACGKRQGMIISEMNKLLSANPDAGKNPRRHSKKWKQLKPVQNVLEAIAALPADLRTGVAARIHLLSVLFGENAHRLSPEASHLVLAEMGADGPGLVSLPEEGKSLWKTLAKDLRPVSDIQKRHDLSRLEPLLRTGLAAETLQAAAVPDPGQMQEAGNVSLLRQLEEHPDSELAALAAVARRVVALFALPRPVGFGHELPVGGISDISNRGTLDRLLPGELATDDLLLMARLAHNEALYFRRDSPPDVPSVKRLILIDSGVPLWGLPRIFLLAAALGLKQAAMENPVSVWQREGSLFQPLDLDNVRGVQQALQALSPHPEAAPALDALVLPDAGCCTDIYFLTGDARHPDTSEALHRLACRAGEMGHRCFVLTAGRSGVLEMSFRSAAGSRVLAGGRIEPALILDAPRKENEEEVSPSASLIHLPAVIRGLEFYRQYPLPFRFPVHPIIIGNRAQKVDPLVGVDQHSRLMKWDESSKGAVEVAAALPAAPDYAIDSESASFVVVCFSNWEQPRAVIIEPERGQRHEVWLDAPPSIPYWLKVQAGAALMCFPDRVGAWSLEDGKQKDVLEIVGPNAAEVGFDGSKLLRIPDPIPEARNGPATYFGNVQFPDLLGAPVSAGFVASGTLVVRAKGGRWELTLPEFIFTPTLKTQLSGVRSFNPVPPDPAGPASDFPSWYVAEWHQDCRLVFDTRGVLHFLFADAHGRVELSFLCLLGKPVPGWLAFSQDPCHGPAEWFSMKIGDSPAMEKLIPYLQRFAALARTAPGPRQRVQTVKLSS